MANKGTDWVLWGLIGVGAWYFFFRKPYKCSICGATFKTQAELDAHMASAHPGQQPGQGELSATVSFGSPDDFKRGSTHTARIQVKNIGKVAATVSYIDLNLQAYGSGAWAYTWKPSIAISPATIQPGATVTYTGQFTIPTNAELGDYRYKLVMNYDSKQIVLSSANAPGAAYAFTVVANSPTAELSVLAVSWV